MQRVTVVGAGVMGLTCAVRLAEAGHRVDVLARDRPLETTSVVAAALWYPYRALPQDRVTAWAATSYDAFAALAQQEEDTAGESAVPNGVRMLPGTEVFAAPQPDPWWREAVPRLDRVEAPGHADAWSFVAPVADMPVYLRWLEARLAELGGTLTRLTLGALPDPGADEVVVDCAGLGARLLAADPTVAPVRGQVALVEQFGLDRWWLDAAGPTYVVPRGDTVVVGGTAEEGDWSRTADPETAADLLRRAAVLVPAVAEATVLQHRVGLRPARPSVRLERVGDVVHCYGQGGSGVTVSWGCADEVAALVAGDRPRPS